MCEFFGVKSRDSRNNSNIKDAITSLENDGLLKSIIDGRTYTLTLSKKAEKGKDVIRIQKRWVEIAKQYKSEIPGKSVSWLSLLKVWLFIIHNRSKLTTSKDIGNALGLSESTVNHAKRALLRDIQAINSTRETTCVDGCYHCFGSIIDASAFIGVSQDTEEAKSV